MGDKIDFKKENKNIYSPKNNPKIITIPKFLFLMIEGVDARPESKDFQEAIQALFSVAYKIKFTVKKEQQFDYTVMPLEGLWWAEDMQDYLDYNKENWRWTLMIRQPDFITPILFTRALSEVKRKIKNSALEKIKLENYTEGLCVQMMHIGPFATEHEDIIAMHKLITNQGGTYDGQFQKHHEIYLNDFRKTAPEKLKTILRQPFILK
jgi:hypothetical protein